jgi:hypothetical protein
MQSTDEQRVETIAGSIAAYWQSHPNAADSMEGIVWWIPSLRTESSELLQRAMALLVERGIARVKRGIDGHAIYSRLRTLS